jgi:transcription factor IIIB 90 kDa subunit
MAPARAPLRCPDCDSYEIDHDPARGDAVCIDCGRVLEESVIVAEVGFAEDSRGRANVVGQHVNASGRPNAFSVLPGFSREATTITMSNGRRRIWHLVSALRLTSRHAEAALRLFRLAVERNFHKGRRMANVCCACLYVVVRIERTPHMLIDFSDVLETNVYVLGNTFLKFAQILNIELPIIDPSLYIHRFASKLEFGDKTHAVAMSALRLLARMRRDWMSYGRRPNGLCGAALIIAARMHNFYRSQTDVVRVVRIGNVALRERLQELDRTPTALLTTAQIDAGGGDDGKVTSLNEEEMAAACDPPSFRRPDVAGSSSDTVSRKESEAVQANPAETFPNKGSSGINVAGINVSIDPARGGRTEADARLEKELAAALSSRELQELELESREGEAATVAAYAGQAGNRACHADQSSREEGQETGLSNDGEQTQIRPDGSSSQDCATNADVDGEEAVKIDDELSDLDDEDAACYLNTEEEYKVKEAVWMELNREYLENQARLEKLKRENPEEYKRQRPWRGSKRKRVSDEVPVSTPAHSPSDTATKATPKSSSRKLNYSVLSKLTGKTVGTPTSSDRPPLPPRSIV